MKKWILAAGALLGLGAVAYALRPRAASTGSAARAGSTPATAAAVGAGVTTNAVTDGSGYVQPKTGTPDAFFVGEENNPAALGGWYAAANLTPAQVAAGGFNSFTTTYDAARNNATTKTVSGAQYATFRGAFTALKSLVAAGLLSYQETQGGKYMEYVSIKGQLGQSRSGRIGARLNNNNSGVYIDDWLKEAVA